jgi:hypothetical protein
MGWLRANTVGHKHDRAQESESPATANALQACDDNGAWADSVRALRDQQIRVRGTGREHPGGLGHGIGRNTMRRYWIRVACFSSFWLGGYVIVCLEELGARFFR